MALHYARRETAYSMYDGLVSKSVVHENRELVRIHKVTVGHENIKQGMHTSAPRHASTVQGNNSVTCSQRSCSLSEGSDFFPAGIESSKSTVEVVFIQDILWI